MYPLKEDSIFIFLVLILGALSFYSDIKYSKVRNKWIILGFLLGSIIYAVLFITGKRDLTYCREVMVNTVLAAILGFSIWYFCFWAAGDAKLFALFSFLIPLGYYKKYSFISFFPSFGFLVNIFALVFLYLLANLCLYLGRYFLSYSFTATTLKNRLVNCYTQLKEKFAQNAVRLSRIIWGYLCIFVLIRLLVDELNKLIVYLPVSILAKLGYIILFFVYRPLFSILGKARKQLWIPTVLLFIYIFLKFLGSQTMIFKELLITFRYFVSFMGMVFIFGRVLDLYINKKEAKLIKIEELKIGMHLTEKSTAMLRTKYDDRFYPDGLTAEQVDRIKKLWPSLNNTGHLIEICNVFPLAPFIFLGALITIIIREPFISFLFKQSFFGF